MKGKVKGAAAVRRWFALAEEALATHSGRLNRLNVFPVPDSDTGANMLATVRACREASETSGSEDLGELLAEAGAEAMGQACGNSGTLLAVLISGFAEPLHGRQRLTVEGLSHGLQRASLRAWSALSQPVEGTMLSVLDAVRDQAQRGAAAAVEPESRAALEEAMGPLVAAAREALVRTEHQLAPLTEARVVDSGGLGLLLVFDALRATIGGASLDPTLLEGLSGWEGTSSHHEAAQSAGHDPGALELMCTARLDPLGAASLRHQLDELGESVIITPIGPGSEAAEDGTYRWRIHVHTAEAEATLSAVRSVGVLESSTLTPLSGASAASAGSAG